jgi:chromosome segregation ATPase
VATETHDREVQRLQKMLAERSTQVATLGAEEKRLRHLLHSSDNKLTSLRRTFEELQERLENKTNGRDSMDTQFSTLNVLYADLMLKYRTLSDAYDEVRILQHLTSSTLMTAMACGFSDGN